MSTPPSVNRGYEDEQQPNPPQVQTPAGQQRSSDSDSCCCEIQNWAIVLAFFHMCVGGIVFFIYSALLTGASEIQVRQCELKQNTNKPEDHFDNYENKKDYEGCLRENDILKKTAGIYRASLGFGMGCSVFMAVSSILLLMAAAKKNRQYSSVCHAFGWIPLIFFIIVAVPLNGKTTYSRHDENDNSNVYLAWGGFFITKSVESIIFYKFNKKLKDLENNDDSWIGVQNNLSNQVHPTTNETIYNHGYNHV